MSPVLSPSSQPRGVLRQQSLLLQEMLGPLEEIARLVREIADSSDRLAAVNWQPADNLLKVAEDLVAASQRTRAAIGGSILAKHLPDLLVTAADGLEQLSLPRLSADSEQGTMGALRSFARQVSSRVTVTIQRATEHDKRAGEFLAKWVQEDETLSFLELLISDERLTLVRALAMCHGRFDGDLAKVPQSLLGIKVPKGFESLIGRLADREAQMEQERAYLEPIVEFIANIHAALRDRRYGELLSEVPQDCLSQSERRAYRRMVEKLRTLKPGARPASSQTNALDELRQLINAVTSRFDIDSFRFQALEAASIRTARAALQPEMAQAASGCSNLSALIGLAQGAGHTTDYLFALYLVAKERADLEGVETVKGASSTRSLGDALSTEEARPLEPEFSQELEESVRHNLHALREMVPRDDTRPFWTAAAAGYSHLKALAIEAEGRLAPLAHQVRSEVLELVERWFTLEKEIQVPSAAPASLLLGAGQLYLRSFVEIGYKFNQLLTTECVKTDETAALAAQVAGKVVLKCSFDVFNPSPTAEATWEISELAEACRSGALPAFFQDPAVVTCAERPRRAGTSLNSYEFYLTLDPDPELRRCLAFVCFFLEQGWQSALRGNELFPKNSRIGADIVELGSSFPSISDPRLNRFSRALQELRAENRRANRWYT